MPFMIDRETLDDLRRDAIPALLAAIAAQALVAAIGLVIATVMVSRAPAGEIAAARDANGNALCPRGPNNGSTATAPLVGPLREKVRDIVAACGSQVISTGCRGGVTPNHRRWRSADLQGNPACIYRHLRGWPGGYSTDYAAVRHVHVSYSRDHEWGLRFRHARVWPKARVAHRAGENP